MMAYTVKPGDAGRINLRETDQVKAALQRVAMVLETRKGSVPMYREFGLDWSILDKPMPVAEMLARTMIREAIERWCEDVTVKGISFQRDEATGALIPTVEVDIHAKS